MDKLEYAKSLLHQIGMPKKQQSDICALSLLAMAGLKRKTSWADATNEWIRIHDIIRFIADNYDVNICRELPRDIPQASHAPFQNGSTYRG